MPGPQVSNLEQLHEDLLYSLPFLCFLNLSNSRSWDLNCTISPSKSSSRSNLTLKETKDKQENMNFIRLVLWDERRGLLTNLCPF